MSTLSEFYMGFDTGPLFADAIRDSIKHLDLPPVQRALVVNGAANWVRSAVLEYIRTLRQEAAEPAPPLPPPPVSAECREVNPVVNPKPWPCPDEAMLARADFDAIWQVIKRWDINVPDVYRGYCGATGNHVRAILDALGKLSQREPETPAPSASHPNGIGNLGKPLADPAERPTPAPLTVNMSAQEAVKWMADTQRQHRVASNQSAAPTLSLSQVEQALTDDLIQGIRFTIRGQSMLSYTECRRRILAALRALPPASEQK